MRDAKDFEVRLLDEDGEIIIASVQENMTQAKEKAMYYLSERYAMDVESSHEDLESRKVEVWKGGECLWDAYILRPLVCL